MKRQPVEGVTPCKAAGKPGAVTQEVGGPGGNRQEGFLLYFEVKIGIQWAVVNTSVRISEKDV